MKSFFHAFLKTAAFALFGAACFLGPAVFAGDDGDPVKGRLHTVTKSKFRIRCTNAPLSDDHVISWLESRPSWEQAETHRIRFDTTGPAKSSISSFRLRPIQASVSSTLFGKGEMFRTSTTPKLGIAKKASPAAANNGGVSYDPYDGGWIEEDAPAPALYYETSGEGMPEHAGLKFAVDASSSTITLAYAYSGFNVHSLGITRAGTSTESTEYYTAHTSGHLSLSSAMESLGYSGENQTPAVIDKIGSRYKIITESKGESLGHTMLEKENVCKKTNIGQPDEQWEPTAEFTSGVSGAISITWTILLERKTRTEHHRDGIMTNHTETDWLPFE